MGCLPHCVPRTLLQGCAPGRCRFTRTAPLVPGVPCSASWRSTSTPARSFGCTTSSTRTSSATSARSVTSLPCSVAVGSPHNSLSTHPVTPGVDAPGRRRVQWCDCVSAVAPTRKPSGRSAGLCRGARPCRRSRVHARAELRMLLWQQSEDRCWTDDFECDRASDLRAVSFVITDMFMVGEVEAGPIQIRTRPPRPESDREARACSAPG